MARPERRDFLKLLGEGAKALFPPLGVGYDAYQSYKLGKLHVSPGTAAGFMLRLGGSAPSVFHKESGIKTDAGELRLKRNIPSFVSDYLPDEKEYTPKERVAFYSKLKELGVTGVRTEFRMGKLMRQDGSFDPRVEKSYVESLKAMKESGLTLSALVFFSPADWMIELAKTDQTRFIEMYRSFAQKAVSMCDQAKQQPRYIQVMNEVNSSFFNKVGTEILLKMIQVTRQVYEGRTERPKIMTTIITDTVFDPGRSWQTYVEKFMLIAGDALDAVGFDYYFFYDHPFEPFVPQSVFDLYQDKTKVFEWLLKQKQTGVLRGKDILVAEMGMPVFQNSEINVYNQKFARIGYDIYYRALDQVLLRWQRMGKKAEDLIAQVGVFCGGDHPSVQTYAPGKIDFLPWTLLRFNKKTNSWDLTEAAKRLAYLNGTRLNAGS